MVRRTWDRTWAPYLRELVTVAGERLWETDRQRLEAALGKWTANSRARQMAYDRFRRLWKEADWPWPAELAPLRGNGRAAADPDGVRAFTDEEIEALRERIHTSTKLAAADLVAWDCLTCFGLRPAELMGLQLKVGPGGMLLAAVSRSKVSSRGKAKPRQVPAVPPAGWPADGYGLMERWREHSLPGWSQTAASPGERMTQQLRRLQMPGVGSDRGDARPNPRLGTPIAGGHPRESSSRETHKRAHTVSTVANSCRLPPAGSEFTEASIYLIRCYRSTVVYDT
jgi:hypothetical protein